MKVTLCITLDSLVNLVNKCYPIIASLGISFIVGMLFYALFGRKEKKITIGIRKEIVIWITMVCSFIALCRTYPTIPLDLDYIGIIVAFFSALVATLIGWNIYTIIDVKSIRKDFEKWKEDTIREVREEAKIYVDKTIKDTKIEMSEHFILEETTFCNAYAKTKEWDKIFPLLRNTALRYFEISKQNKKDDFKISGFVSAVAEIMDKIDDDSFNELRSDIAGFMEYFKELWKYDKDVSKICELYEQKEKHIKNPPKLTKSQYFTCDIKYVVKRDCSDETMYMKKNDSGTDHHQFSFKNCKLNEAHLFSSPNAAMAAYRDRTDISTDKAVNSRPIIISVIESKKETTTL